MATHPFGAVEIIMSMSLREQLLAAGLVTKKQAEQAENQNKQQRHQHAKGKKPAPVNEAKKAAQQAQAAKAARDAELNRKRQESLEAKQKADQIRQLIETHQLPRLETDDYFNFVDRGKVRRMSVDAQRREQLIAETLKIVRFEGKYGVVPPEIAAKIGELNAKAVVSLDAKSETAAAPAEDDPYKDFVVPDDLRW
jgi:uncharacterized protein YaiL (DUF2058 family)